MKKTINISLGGLKFTVEEDAYNKLDAYLKDVRAHFSSYKESDEIVKDIEARFAEQFSANANSDRIITLGEVEKVILIMGSPEQFGDQPGEKSKIDEKPNASVPKKFFRDPDNVIIAGVASGLAAFLGIDPIWMRLAFALSIFLGGTGIVVYLILWIIVPEAKTETEKMQMRGEPINLKNLEQTIKERAEELKKNSGKFKTATSAPLRVFGKIIRGIALVFLAILKIIVKVIGAALAAAGIIGAAALVFSICAALFNSNSPYIDFPVRAVAHGTIYYTGITAAFFTAFIPLLVLTLIGITMVLGRSAFKKAVGFSLLGLWIVAMAVAINVGIKMGPEIENAINNSPEYQKISRELDLKDFTKIDLHGGDTAEVRQGDVYNIVVEGRLKDLDNTSIEVKDGVLLYHYTKEPYICIFCWSRQLHFTITMPQLDTVDASGASDIKIDAFNSNNFKIKLTGASKAETKINSIDYFAELSGASHLTIEGTTTKLIIKESGASRVNAENLMYTASSTTGTFLNADLSGASRLVTTGNITSLKLEASGHSKIDAKNTTIENADIILSGASKATLGDVGNLKTDLSGASDVYYKSAKQTDNHTSGASSVEPSAPNEDE